MTLKEKKAKHHAKVEKLAEKLMSEKKMDCPCKEFGLILPLSNSIKTLSTFVATILNNLRLLLSRNKSVANKKELVLFMSKLILY